MNPQQVMQVLQRKNQLLTEKNDEYNNGACANDFNFFISISR